MSKRTNRWVERPPRQALADWWVDALPEVRERFITRFWLLVDRRGPGDCWPWLGHTEALNGYGTLNTPDGQRITAHRMALAAETGELPWKALACPRSKTCCNPAHVRECPRKEHRTNAEIQTAYHDWLDYYGLDPDRFALERRYHPLRCRVAREIGGYPLGEGWITQSDLYDLLTSFTEPEEQP